MHLLLVAIFVASRILVLASAHAGALTMTPEKHSEWDWNPGKSDLFNGPPPPSLLAPLIRWDANFYLTIAEHGYRTADSKARPNYQIAFFPLYPLAVRALRNCGVNVFWSAILVSNLGCLAAAFLLLEIGRTRWTPAAGFQSAVLLLVAPGSHFLSMPYPEGLFAALLAGALLAIVKRRFWVAAILGAFASATRSAGVVVFVCLAYQAWRMRHEDGAGARRALVAAPLSLAGVAAFSFFCFHTYGDPLAFAHIEPRFHRVFSILGPLEALFRFEVDPDYYLVTGAAVIAVVILWRTIRGVESMAAAFLVALPLFTGTLKAMIRFQSVNLGLIAGLPPAAPRATRGVLIGCVVLLVVETFLFGKGIGHN